MKFNLFASVIRAVLASAIMFAASMSHAAPVWRGPFKVYSVYSYTQGMAGVLLQSPGSFATACSVNYQAYIPNVAMSNGRLVDQNTSLHLQALALFAARNSYTVNMLVDDDGTCPYGIPTILSIQVFPF